MVMIFLGILDFLSISVFYVTEWNACYGIKLQVNVVYSYIVNHNNQYQFYKTDIYCIK